MIKKNHHENIWYKLKLHVDSVFCCKLLLDLKINEVVRIFEYIASNSPKKWLNHSDLGGVPQVTSHMTNRRSGAEKSIPTHEILVAWMEPQYRFLHPHQDAEDFIPNLHPQIITRVFQGKAPVFFEGEKPWMQSSQGHVINFIFTKSFVSYCWWWNLHHLGWC